MRRLGAWILVGSPVAVVVAMGLPSCSTNKAAVGLAAGCSLNSDCQSPLVCVYSLCHEACQEQRDCPTGQLCVPSPSGSDHVCQLPSEGSCADGGTCHAQETCSAQGQCGTSCTAANMATTCVSGQECDPNGACVAATGDAGPGGDASAGDSPSGDSTTGDAPISDGPAVEAGPLGYVPSNIGSLMIADGGVPVTDGGKSPLGADGGLDFADAPDVTISGNCSSTCLPAPIVVTQPMGPEASLYVLHSLTVDSSATLAPSDNRPVILAVLGPVDVQGTISVAANNYQGFAGATTWIGPSGPQGPGGGGNGGSANFPNSGGGGGSFCGVGGLGGATSGAQAIGGSVYGNATITPLQAGSAGGNSNNNYWGAGGGAIQISSGTSITVRSVGIITASGGGEYSGGGSGGAILLEAPTLDLQGYVTANGGGGGALCSCGSVPGNNGRSDGQPASGATPAGSTIPTGGNGSAGSTVNGSPGTFGDASTDLGGGGGGAGWIRLNSSSGSATISGTISPDLTMCASQGKL